MQLSDHAGGRGFLRITYMLGFDFYQSPVHHCCRDWDRIRCINVWRLKVEAVASTPTNPHYVVAEA